MVAQRQVPHLRELEDVAGLHLVAVVLEAAIPVLRHHSAAAPQRLQHLLDGGLVDDLAKADPVGVLGRHVDRHVVVQDLNREVFAFLTEHFPLVLLDHGARSVMRIHDLIADLVQARPPVPSGFTKAPAGRQPPANDCQDIKSCWKTPLFSGTILKNPCSEPSTPLRNGLLEAR